MNHTHAAMAEEGEQGGGGDPRIQTLQQFTLKAMKQVSMQYTHAGRGLIQLPNMLKLFKSQYIY